MDDLITIQAGHIIAQTDPAFNQVGQVLQEMAHNAQEVAHQMGYEGALTVGALEDEIRFYQKRTAEACLELGKRLLLLKELTAHGEFKQRIELLGIEYTVASRLMKAALKFSKVATSQLLNAACNQSKLLELLVLDDGDIAALGQGETVAGVSLDAIETMSASELRKALRQAKADAVQQREANDRIFKEKNDYADELARRLHITAEERWQQHTFDYLQELHNLRTYTEKQLYKLLRFIDTRSPEPEAPTAEWLTVASATVDCMNSATEIMAQIQQLTHLCYRNFIDQPIHVFGEPLSLKPETHQDDSEDL